MPILKRWRVVWSQGFTEVEILIILVILLILLVGSIEDFNSFGQYSSVESEIEEIHSALTLARGKSMAEIDDSRFKVVLTATSYSVQREDGQVVEKHIANENVQYAYSASTVTFDKISGTANSTCSGAECTISVQYLPALTPSQTIHIPYTGVMTITNP